MGEGTGRDEPIVLPGHRQRGAPGALPQSPEGNYGDSSKRGSQGVLYGGQLAKTPVD